MVSSTMTLEEETSTSNSLRRLSLKPRRTNTSDTSTSESRSSIQDQSRRSSLANLSNKFRRSKKLSKNVEFQNENAQIGERFLDLPAEIQLQVFSYLTAKDILAFRISSRHALAIVQSNYSTIALHVLRTLERNSEKVGYISLLYQPLSYNRDDTFLLQMLHRERVIQRQLHVVLTFIQTRVYMLKLNANLQCQHFAPYRAGLYSHLYTSAWYAEHFLDSIRNLVTLEHPAHPFKCGEGDTIASCPDCLASARTIVSTYPQHELVSLHQFLQILILHLRNATRAPSFVGALERKLRGWGHGPPPDKQLGEFVFLGGLEEVSKINEMEGSYGKRLAFVTEFTTKLADAIRANALAWPHLTSSTYPVQSLDPPYMVLDQSVLDSVPDIDSFLLGPDSVLGERILAENLVDHQRELLSPYGWVQRLMASCYRSEYDKSNRSRSDSISGRSVGRPRFTLTGADFSDEENDFDDDLPGIEAE